MREALHRVTQDTVVQSDHCEMTISVLLDLFGALETIDHHPLNWWLVNEFPQSFLAVKVLLLNLLCRFMFDIEESEERNKDHINSPKAGFQSYEFICI